ncbi:MAG: hypothetical protein HY243_00495 [Proteobacteria bacterium]|nr:hypothetical protein [Pseudomonadota bacterium]
MNLVTRNLTRVLLTAGIIACSVCGAAAETAEPTAAVTSDKDAYIIIGIRPENAKVLIVRGTNEDGQFSVDGWAKPTFVDYPNDGYIVAKAKPGDYVGIDWVFWGHSKGSFWGTIFYNCKGSKTLVFTVPAGKVVYLTDVYFTPNGYGASVKFGASDIETVRAYLMTHYPSLADKVEQGQYETKPADGIQCPMSTR